MTVLVTSDDGCHVFTTSGEHHMELDGHRVEALTRRGDGSHLSVLDHTDIGRRDHDGTWSTVAKGDSSLTAVVAVGDTIFAGTLDARVLIVDADGSLEPLPAFETVRGREEWHAVGIPLCVRSLTATCDGTALLANVHVGGIPRSLDGGSTWEPTIEVEADVHQVLAHPTRPDIAVAAASIGLCRSRDGGATWDASTAGMHASYARAVAILDDDVLISVSDGPFASQSAIYRASVDGGPASRVVDGPPDWLDGNVDTACLAADGNRAALVDGGGNVYVATKGSAAWERVAEGIPHTTGIGLA